jgi:hypothetical protein
MSIFTIYRAARHFYFNYHYPESTSVWIHSAFMQRIQYAFQKVICFLTVGFLGFGSRFAQNISPGYLVPVVSILCLQQTFGATLSCCYKITLAITPLSIFLFVIQKIGLGYHDYLATELLLLITSFCISYGCTQVNILIFEYLHDEFIFSLQLKDFLYFIMLFIFLRIFLNQLFHQHLLLNYLQFLLWEWLWL